MYVEAINTGNVDKCLPKSIAFINFICALLQKKHPEIESQIFCKSSIILKASLCNVDLYCVKLLQISQINIPSVSCKPLKSLWASESYTELLKPIDVMGMESPVAQRADSRG